MPITSRFDTFKLSISLIPPVQPGIRLETRLPKPGTVSIFEQLPAQAEIQSRLIVTAVIVLSGDTL
jgi:hypothetical protein